MATRHAGVDEMGGYHLYIMDRFSGHIDHRRDFLAESDAAAAQAAQQWFDGSPMELWLGSRKIKRWEAEPVEALWTSPESSSNEG